MDKNNNFNRGGDKGGAKRNRGNRRRHGKAKKNNINDLEDYFNAINNPQNQDKDKDKNNEESEDYNIFANNDENKIYKGKKTRKKEKAKNFNKTIMKIMKKRDLISQIKKFLILKRFLFPINN